MCGTIDWRNKTVRERLMGKMAIGEALVIVTMVLMAALFVGLTMTTHSNRTQSAMKGSVIRSAAGIIGDSARRLDQQLTRRSRAVDIQAFIAQDSFRGDHPWLPPSGALMNMDDPSLVRNPAYRADYRNFQLPLALYRSSYHVKNRTPRDIGSFSADLNRSISTAFIMDQIAVRQFTDSNGVISSIYKGFLTPERYFVECPGMGATNVTGYDWTTDPLSPTALANPDADQLSEAYLDPYVKKRLGSIARSFRNISNWNTVAGVAGLDVVLTELSATLQGVIFANVSRAALYSTENDEMFVDSDLAKSDADPLVPDADVRANLYSGSTCPEVTTDGPDLGGVCVSGVFVVELSDYIYFAQQLESNAYVIVNRVPMSYVDDRMAVIRSNDRKAGVIAAVVFVLTIVLGVSLASWLVYRAANLATKPLPQLTRATEEIPRNHLGATATLGAPAIVPAPAHIEGLVEEEKQLHDTLTAVTILYNKSRQPKPHAPNPDYKPNGGAGYNTVVALPVSLTPDQSSIDNVSLAKRALMAATRSMDNLTARATSSGDAAQIERTQLQRTMHWPFILVMQAEILNTYDNAPAAAKFLYQYILDRFSHLEPSVRQKCILGIKGELSPHGAGAPGVDHKSSVDGGFVKRRRFILVLDISGSMGTGDFPLIVPAREGLIKLISNPKLVPPDSEISILAFSNAIYDVLNFDANLKNLDQDIKEAKKFVLGSVGGEMHTAIVKCIQQNTEPFAGTCLYNSITFAYDQLKRWSQKEPGRNDFIFVITDGVNNRPPEKPLSIIQRNPQPAAKVGIFTVGNIMTMEGGPQANEELVDIAKAVGPKPANGIAPGFYASIEKIDAVFAKLHQIVLAAIDADEAL